MKRRLEDRPRKHTETRSSARHAGARNRSGWAFRQLFKVLAFGAVVALVTLTSGTATSATGTVRSASSASAPPLVFAQENGWATSWSLNPFNPNWNGELDNLTLLPFAYAKPPKLGAYIPELATSWKINGSQVTIKLRPNARWQNGRPFTSHDALVSLELDGAAGNNLWAQTAGMTTPNAHTLVMKLRPGGSAGLLVYEVLGQYPVPSSVYGRFLPSGFQHDLVSYYAEAASNPAGASSSAAGKALSTAFTKLTKYSPKTYIGDGPYRELGITTSQMKLRAWSGYWGAKRIHVANIIGENITSNEGIYPLYFSHQVDFSNTAMLKNVLDRWLHTTDHGYQTMSNYVGYGLVFNNRKYPLNITKFRQAIAYVIDRPKVAILAYGGLRLMPGDRYEDGLDYSLQSAWLSRSELEQLNTYPLDPTKAASILRSLHFTKKNGQWFAPNGKSVTLSITFEAGDNDAQGMAAAAGNELTNFGLKTQVIGAGTPAYVSEVAPGNFDIAWEFVAGGGLDPLSDQASEIGTTYNFVPVATGSAKKEPGIGFGPKYDVPGLGSVPVAPTITREAATVGPGPQMSKLAWDWARVINKNLPYLTLADKNQQIEYSTYHYVHWPSASSPDWKLMGLNLMGAFTVELQQGYIRPRP